VLVSGLYDRTDYASCHQHNCLCFLPNPHELSTCEIWPHYPSYGKQSICMNVLDLNRRVSSSSLTYLISMHWCTSIHDLGSSPLAWWKNFKKAVRFFAKCYLCMFLECYMAWVSCLCKHKQLALTKTIYDLSSFNSIVFLHFLSTFIWGDICGVLQFYARMCHVSHS